MFHEQCLFYLATAYYALIIPTAIQQKHFPAYRPHMVIYILKVVKTVTVTLLCHNHEQDGFCWDVAYYISH